MWALGSALVGGVLCGLNDASPNWDDTGITAGCIALLAGVSAFLSPRKWIYVALSVGIWVPLFELNQLGSGSWIPLAIAFAAAAVGAGCARAVSRGESKDTRPNSSS